MDGSSQQTRSSHGFIPVETGFSPPTASVRLARRRARVGAGSSSPWCSSVVQQSTTRRSQPPTNTVVGRIRNVTNHLPPGIHKNRRKNPPHNDYVSECSCPDPTTQEHTTRHNHRTLRGRGSHDTRRSRCRWTKEDVQKQRMCLLGVSIGAMETPRSVEDALLERTLLQGYPGRVREASYHNRKPSSVFSNIDKQGNQREKLSRLSEEKSTAWCWRSVHCIYQSKTYTMLVKRSSG